MALIVTDGAELRTGRAAESGHWYDRQGRAVYEIKGANGKIRPVTLRDARKLNLVPGFSSIAAMEYKPLLERWKIEQALMAAITLPRLPNETDDQYIDRARDDSMEQAAKARDRGTEIHAAIQGYFEGAPVSYEMAPFVFPVRDFLYQRFGSQGWIAESSFAHPLGFGGKSDLMKCLEIEAVIDVKCKDFDETKTAKDLAWPEHSMQLSAYSRGFKIPRADCANIFVSTRVPGLIRVREWDKDELEEAWEAFGCLLKLWQIRRNYRCGWGEQEAA